MNILESLQALPSAATVSAVRHTASSINKLSISRRYCRNGKLTGQRSKEKAIYIGFLSTGFTRTLSHSPHSAYSQQRHNDRRHRGVYTASFTPGNLASSNVDVDVGINPLTNYSQPTSYIYDSHYRYTTIRI
ncbi:hypothetical protein QAD02_003877 [Eretmocerus hayati]|uniref:Uncharacterized protein n=1 Tax=Eretmocerus hayati TaxID=131215 RepID=A0ACC2NP65_9HYME|nr:hypothetical protein QAD02_003877 [Eretmocerus hayati]